MTTTVSTQQMVPSKGAIWQILKLRNVRFLWIGETISVLGDQFYFLALPWLVLQLTGDPLAVGAVLAASGIPRAVFMLVGGSLVDRFSPRALMLWSNIARMLLVACLAVFVLSGYVNLWLIYLFALLFGLMDAFFFPAQTAIIPQIVGEKDLQTANALIQGTAQLSMFLGPVLAGSIIALFGGATSTLGMAGGHAFPAQLEAAALPGLVGIGLAFVVDAFTFLVSTIMLWFMQTEQTTVETDTEEGMWQSTLAGIGFVWHNLTLRWLFVMIAIVTFLVNGPIVVGIPILADNFPQGAAAFGIISSAFGLGSLIGTVLAGVLPQPKQYFGWIFAGALASLGGMVALFGIARTMWGAAFIMLLVGVVDGYLIIMFITWLQARTPKVMMGRMMALLMMASFGLHPVSSALAGVFFKMSVTGVFVGAGVLMTLFSLLMFTRPEIIQMGRLQLTYVTKQLSKSSAG